MSDTKRASLEDIRAMQARGEVQGPGASVPTPPEELADDFWDDAEVVLPKTKKQVNLRVDPDIIDFFKSQGAGHLTRMHAVLRSYVDAQKRRSG